MVTTEERVEIQIEEDVNVAKRSLLVTKLEYERGIISAWFAKGDDRCLTVHYRPEHFSHATLLDTLREFGYHGKITGS